MDHRLVGWVLDNPAVHRSLVSLHATMPGMQVAFIDSSTEFDPVLDPQLGIDGRTLVVRPTPGADPTHVVEPDGSVFAFDKQE